jgi:hypothetical protein
VIVAVQGGVVLSAARAKLPSLNWRRNEEKERLIDWYGMQCCGTEEDFAYMAMINNHGYPDRDKDAITDIR